ncbi:MAG: DUF4026 domain-containing protein, partial [Firmicutes bacterium]|nr:DUF4026 domain-containing protein [Bacillota bacterium]
MGENKTRELSYMLAVPEDPTDVANGVLHLARLKNAKDFTVDGLEEKAGELQLTIGYLGKEYTVRMIPTEFKIPELYRIQHFFSDADVDKLKKAKEGLGVIMEFGDDPLESYHLQLKIIHAALPKKLAVFDDSAEKVLSGKWVELAAASAIAPAPRYLYTAQAVSDEAGTVWLHSHGLNRCGLSELEVLASDQENYQSHYGIMEVMANRMLELGEPLEEGEPLYLAQLSEDVHLVTTHIHWNHAVKYFDETLLGGQCDREEGHNGNTGVIFAYPTQEAFEQGQLSSIRVYDALLKDNPLYLVSAKESDRMKALAQARLNYVEKAYEDPTNKILLKLELKGETLWFELMQILPEAGDEGEELLVQDLNTGSMGEYAWDQVTDWLIYTSERR